MMRNFLTAAVLLLVVVGTVVVYGSAFVVHQTEIALVLEFGSPKRVINVKPKLNEAGLHWKTPFIQTVELFDKRLLNVEISATDSDKDEDQVVASDQKRLIVDAFARYKITDPLMFYQATRNNQAVARSLLEAKIRSNLKNVLASATFIEIVRDKREALMHEIAKRTNDQANDEKYGVEVVDVRIVRADLPEQNREAIFKRMKSERKREAEEARARGNEAAQRIRATAERQATVIRAEARQKAEIMRGEGDAERNRIYAEAFSKDPDFFAFYRSMQAYEEGLKSNETRMVISPSTEFFRYFNDPDGKSTPAQRSPKNP
jgi:membrane protease subunit HflC